MLAGDLGRESPVLLSHAQSKRVNNPNGGINGYVNGHTYGSANGHKLPIMGYEYTESPDEYVGFSNLPNQVHRKAVRRGFEFNLMVVGESGLGKSTFINSLFLSDVYNAENPGPSVRKKTTAIQTHTVMLKENGVNLKLSLVDTPGFGDAIDNSHCWQPITDYINAKFDDYIAEESRITRCLKNNDGRIHACVFFIAATGHKLKPLDLEFLAQIQDKVNVIPVIAKGDTMTMEECSKFKRTVLDELTMRKIRTYNFPDLPECADEEQVKKLHNLRNRLPFAVVGSNTLITNDSGVQVRARSYPWGVVEVENLQHNDFAALRYLLLNVYMQELRNVTHNVHYENYRTTKMSGIAMESHFQTKDGKNPMSQMETEKREHEAKMRKMEMEMEAVFEQKVQEKTNKLREFEADLLRRADQLREQIRAQEQEVAASRRAFELERSNWEENWRELDVRADTGANGGTMGLGDRVMNEALKERAKTEQKKKKGLF